ncbi:hypothetical protein GUJ93_ZPchr0006g44887 [Zizania palustris]|uniref:Glabrous enhancer-binding protein-like DBD domain-containing protein n=1 Tax=Zizania palustris TaxID=103762 RepID=A0A8J5S7Z0_ZIZPA|nr:hypothetical protein GUJ93_ZPchr0006g44887 [Zizania palustris]
MARKRRSPSPSPPPPPPQPESSEEISTSEEEGEEEVKVKTSPAVPAPQKPIDHGAASSEGEEVDSDTDTYAQAFQLLKVVRSPGDKGGEDEEEGGSSESEPEKPEPVRKEEAKKPIAEAKKKRSAPEPALSGKAKKAKGVEKTAPEPVPSGKPKKAAKAEAGKAAPDTTLSSKTNKSRVKPEKMASDPSPSSNKSGKTGTRWTTGDEIKIVEVMAKHVKSHGTHPKPDEIIAALGDSLDRKNSSRSDMYEKVRRLKQRYEITAKKVAENSTLPVKDDDLQMYKLSLEIWGKDAKEVVSGSTVQNNGTPSKSKKGQAKKEKMDGDSKEATTAANKNGGTLVENRMGKTTKQKATVETKIKSSKDVAPTATPAKSKKRRNHKDKLDEETKNGPSKEITITATHDDSTLVEDKRGKADKEKLDRDTDSVMPKEATTATQNVGILTNSKGGETHKEKIETDATATGVRREFVELQRLYPNLASFVKIIDVQHPCGGTFKRAFEFISNDKACTLESKIKKQKVAEVRMQLRRADTRKEITNILLGLLD